ncbi:leucyl aminopeptidase [Crepidotus variabilis]|uniref:Aminopeptidase n=1 Tax=Crepidotus variabilis TaxID=179855 RepID=A0A9P6EQU0_9AGAR|nr:leucyl aminopeptidase [Crepidotus variabilis]
MGSLLSSAAKDDQYRLPTDIKPTHYNITIKTDLEKLAFHGLIKVDLEVVAETSTITLNMANLSITKVFIISKTSSVEHTLMASFDTLQQRITFKIPKSLPTGSHALLVIRYSGELTGSMLGYYKSAYEVDGETKHYALTHFEPTSARRAFPCWDEPLLKATFAITMISRKGTINLSNMSAISEEPLNSGVNTSPELEEILGPIKDDNWKITKFETTPVMSSYLVALANGEFEYFESSVKMPLSKKILPLRIYATKEHIHQAQFALDAKAAVLPLYEKIFNVEYPLPKLDTLVASDFDASAMENWGLITGKITVFLLDPDSGDLQAKKLVASIQSHEVAHMWFGNITTLEWWTYVHLNEGFATLMGEVIIPDKIWPEWRVNSEFITGHLNRALSLDAKISSHPIEVDIPDPNHVSQPLQYCACCLLTSAKMCSSKVFPVISRSICLETPSRKIFGKAGFPVLTVTEDEKGISIKQDRFMEANNVAEENKTVWNVPLKIVTEKDGQRHVDNTHLLAERTTHVKLDASKSFKLNADTTGVYRVLYTPERLAVIAAEATKENSIFSLEDRLGLVQDSFASAKAGLAKVSGALTLVESWENENEYLVLSGIGDITNLISTFWESPKIVDGLNTFRRTLFVPIVEKLGYDYPSDESHDVRLLRTIAISQAAYAEDKSVVADLQSRFKHYTDTGDDSQIASDLQRVVFTTATKYGGRSEWKNVVELHDRPRTPQEKNAAIFALGATQDEDLIKETLEFIGKKARDQDIVLFFSGLGSNFKARRALTEYFQKNYDILFKRFESNFSLPFLVKLSSEYYSSMKDLELLEEFYQDKDTSKYKLALAQTLDEIRARAGYVTRSLKEIVEWLGKRK